MGGLSRNSSHITANQNNKKNNILSNLNLPMEVSLPNSIGFGKIPIFLLKEPEETTYRYIDTETKKIDSITFKSFLLKTA